MLWEHLTLVRIQAGPPPLFAAELSRSAERECAQLRSLRDRLNLFPLGLQFNCFGGMNSLESYFPYWLELEVFFNCFDVEEGDCHLQRSFFGEPASLFDFVVFRYNFFGIDVCFDAVGE